MNMYVLLTRMKLLYIRYAVLFMKTSDLHEMSKHRKTISKRIPNMLFTTRC